MTSIYEFWSMKRSGMHAIFEWLFYNKIGNQKRIYISTHSFYSDNFLYINDGEKDSLIHGMRFKPKYLFISYEELPTSKSIINLKNTQKFVIIRSLKNVVASRIKKYQEPSDIHNLFAVDENFFNTWENHASSNFNTIYYDNWLTNIEYRNELSMKFMVDNKDRIDVVPFQGGGSSFVQQKLDSKNNLLNRHKQVSIDDKLMNEINIIESKYPMFKGMYE